MIRSIEGLAFLTIKQAKISFSSILNERNLHQRKDNISKYGLGFFI